MHKNLDTEYIENDDKENCCNKKLCWWAPSPESIPESFCSSTSIHGLGFLGHPKRHLTERIFWIVIFITSFATAVYLICTLWDRHEKTPVIVSFQSEEQDIGSIPFPAVTFCNVNKFRKTKIMELQRIAKMPNHSEHELAKQQLGFVSTICGSQVKSFAKQVGYANTRGEMEFDGISNDAFTDDSQNPTHLIDFLLEFTIPCEELLRHCMFEKQVFECQELFKPIITDFGKCCTFNILPLPLLLKIPHKSFSFSHSASIYDNPALGTKRYWSTYEVGKWINWNYDNGFVHDNTPGQERPYRQMRAGLQHGLSVLVDSGTTDDYFCPASDSEGVRYVLHNPIEMPRVMEYASVANLEKEILINVHPDVTNADDDIRTLEPNKRKCYYGKEYDLNIFAAYTAGNCMDECVSLILATQCNCTFLFMPRETGVRICNPESAKDRSCMFDAQYKLEYTVLGDCAHCRPLCKDIAYKYDTTNTPLQNASRLWFDTNSMLHPDGTPSWANHKMSVMHIFFGSETTVPKVRHRLYGTTDLIANIGGILGICLGVSVLSIVEVFYFMTLRAFWSYCRYRKRLIVRKVAKRFSQMLKSTDNRVVCLNPNLIPVYPNTF